MYRDIIVSSITTLLVLIGMVSPLSAQRISGIINSYAKVTSFDACSKKITVLNATGFRSGEKALLIQMQGADADTSQSPTFGTVTAYNDAGNFEFVKIKSIRDNEIEFEFVPLFNYDVQGNVQLVTVPSYRNTVFVNGLLTARPWDGATGGVLVFETTAALDLDVGSIDVSGLGFLGGLTNNGSRNIFNVATYYNSASQIDSGAAKGEGIVRALLGKEHGRGSLANGGGGGNGHNAGGGGGANGGAGGVGGKEYHNNPLNAIENGGLGGKVPEWNRNNTIITPRLFMGGGGGAGQMNNNVGSAGARGGGIIIIRAKNIVGRNKVIKSNGASQTAVSLNDGGGGGGAGGSIFLDVDQILSAQGFTIQVNGGAGGNVNTGTNHGAGGGGGGGVVFINDQQFQDKITLELQGGKNGVNIANNNSTLAKEGLNGQPVFGARIPESTAPELSIGILKNEIICKGSSRRIGAPATGGRQPYTYDWTPITFLDNPTAAQPTTMPEIAMRYTVIVTDAAGCKDTAVVSVNLFSLPEIELADTVNVCLGNSQRIEAKGIGKFRWTPTNDLQFADSANPIITPTQSGWYYVTLTDINSCSQADSVFVKVNPLPTLRLPDTVFSCVAKEIILSPANETGAAPLQYRWTSSENITNPSQKTLQFIPQKSARYILTIQDGNGCVVKDSVEVVLFSEAQADAGKNDSVCIGATMQLQATGGTVYAWSPNEDITDTTSPNPIVSPRNSRYYYVRIENDNGCIGYDSVYITVLPLPETPIITQSTDTLFIDKPSNNAMKIVWKYNGEVIVRDSHIVIADKTGTYTVEIIDDNGCSIESAPISFSIANAQFCTETVRARVGEIITLPIYVCNTRLLSESKTTSIEANVSFNKTTLLPIGDYSENTIVGNRRILKIQGNVPQDTTQPFAFIKVQALLGTDTLTRIIINNGKSIGGKILFTSGSGIFITDGICLEGGVRLWQDGDITSIQSVQHYDNTSTIAYSLSSTEPHKIVIATSLGAKAAEFNPTIYQSGQQLFEFDNSGLSSGIYFITIITPTEKSVAMFHIIR
jgi:hypothetical protein